MQQQGLLDRNPMAKAVRGASGTEDPQAQSAAIGDAENPFGEGEQASPEEQAAYESYIQAAIKIIYEDDNGHKSVVNMLQAMPNKIQAVIDATIVVLKEIDRQLDIIPDALSEVAMDILDMMFELMAKAVKQPFDEKMEKKAVLGLTGRLHDEYGDDQQDVMNLVSKVDSPQKADRLSAILRDAAT
jgi:iron-sulfur cluster repair protein YtfE (RIC family)